MNNSWTKQKSAAILRQLRDITDSVEQLDAGICQLEAKQLVILTAPFTTKQMRVEANYHTAMNNSTAQSIKTSLREIEEVVNTEMQSAPDCQDLIKEFIKVLRSSIRVLHEYRMVQQSYVDELNKRVSISPIPYRPFTKKDNKKSGNTSCQLLRRLVHLLRQTCHCFS